MNEKAERDLKEYYSRRSSWRRSDEETMRFKAASKIAQVPDRAFVLDIGCRDGGLKNFLPSGVVYRGMDIAEEFRSEDIAVGDASHGIPFDDNFFDFVFAIEVCEHATDPFTIFRETNRILKPEGFFIVSVPNPYHFKEIIWNIFRVPDKQGHIFSWTRQAMIQFGTLAGFKLIKTNGTYFHPPIPAKGLCSRSIIYKFQKRISIQKDGDRR